MRKVKDEMFNLSELKKNFDGIQGALNVIRTSVMAAATEFNKAIIKKGVAKPVVKKAVKVEPVVVKKAVKVEPVKKVVKPAVGVARPEKAYTQIKYEGQTFKSASSAATYLLKTTTLSQSEIARRLGVTATLVCQLAKAAKTA